ncbi:MAG: hypothetical protein AAF616_15415 [Bacteroidota bacterium]
MKNKSLKPKKMLRWVLGAVLLTIGTMGAFDHFLNGYNPESEGIMLFGDTFRNLHNAIMMSFLGPMIRILHILIGLSLFSRYWFAGLLVHLPIAINIFLIHVVHDLPFANLFFFSMGMFVSISTFILLFLEKGRLKAIIYADRVKRYET